MSSLIKEINRLISKGMYVLLLDIFNGFLKSDVLKTSILSERYALPLKSKKVQSIFGETFILTLSSLAVFRLQNSVSDFF